MWVCLPNLPNLSSLHNEIFVAFISSGLNASFQEFGAYLTEVVKNKEIKLTADGRRRTPTGMLLGQIYHREATVRVIPRVSAVKKYSWVVIDRRPTPPTQTFCPVIYIIILSVFCGEIA